MKRLRENGLGIVLITVFAALLLAQFIVGRAAFNEELTEHGRTPLSSTEYMTSGHFLEATSENWESEFLQMGAYVLLTVFLVQKGSAESKKPDQPEEVDFVPSPEEADPTAPWPVRAGGAALWVYAHSLSLVFFGLFLASFIWHGYGGFKLENEERALDGLPAVTLGDFVTSSQFWFESLQNWQSEFLAVAAIVLLTIWLREKGSPESKPVASSHSETGK